MASNSNCPTRLGYASDENGLPDIQESHRTTLKSKCRTFLNGIIMEYRKTRETDYEKRMGNAIPAKDNVRQLFKPEKSGGAGRMTVFIPVD